MVLLGVLVVIFLANRIGFYEGLHYKARFLKKSMGESTNDMGK